MFSVKEKQELQVLKNKQTTGTLSTEELLRKQLLEDKEQHQTPSSERKLRATKELVFEITDIEPHSDPNKNVVYVHGEDIDGNSITVSFGSGVVARRETVIREDVVIRAKVEVAIAGKTQWENKDGTTGDDEWSGYAGTFDVRRVAKSRWANMQQAAKLRAYSKDSGSLEAIAALADAGANVNLNLI